MWARKRADGSGSWEESLAGEGGCTGEVKMDLIEYTALNNEESGSDAIEMNLQQSTKELSLFKVID